MSMYRGKRFFDREQLVFVVDTILTAALDRAESCLPPCVTDDDYYDHRDDITSWIAAGVETAGMGLAIFYAQLTEDGISAGDVIEILKFREFVQALVDERANDGPKVTPEGKNMPDCRPLAEKFVDELFSDYLNPDWDH